MLIVQVYKQKMDRNGNTNYAIRVSNHDANVISGIGIISGDESNVRSALRSMFNGDYEITRRETFLYTTEIGVREFDQLVKGKPYAGCTDTEIATWIRSELSL